jgi:hypothetical protein
MLLLELAVGTCSAGAVAALFTMSAGAFYVTERLLKSL